RVATYDYSNARLDALAAEGVIDNYPRWVREMFLFSAIRAALETKDTALAQHFIGKIDFAKLDPEAATWYQFYVSWIAEAQGRTSEAIDGYGQVIVADFRPTRAESIYRTMRILDAAGKLDLAKATR